jgi:hypothetical protein
MAGMAAVGEDGGGPDEQVNEKNTLSLKHQSCF